MALCCKSVLLANTLVAEPQSCHPDRGIVRLQIPKSMSKEFARTSIKKYLTAAFLLAFQRGAG